MQVFQEPGAAGVGGFVLESPVQLRGMPHDLVNQQGVEARVGDYRYFPVRRLQRRGGGYVGGVPPQVSAEGGEVGQVYGAVVVTPGQDLPTPLVAGGVVKLVAAVFAAADDKNEALGLGEGLVNVSPLGADEKLSRQEGGGGCGGEEDIPGPASGGPAAIHCHAHSIPQRHGEGVGFIDGGNGVLGHGDPGQEGVVQAAGHGGETPPGLGFLAGVGAGALVGLANALPDHRLDAVQVGGAQDLAVEAGSGHPLLGDDPDPEPEGYILGTGLFQAVFRRAALFFPYLDAKVAVAELGKGPGPSGYQRQKLGPDGIQVIYGYGVGHTSSVLQVGLWMVVGPEAGFAGCCA